MKYLLSLLVIFGSICLHGQNPERETFRPKKIQFGITFSPDLCYRALSNPDGDGTESLIIDVLNNRESPKLSYTTGIKVHILLKEKVGFQTGILYSNKGYRTESSSFAWPNQGSSMIRSTTFVYNYHYIDIPALLKFKIGSGANPLYFGAGIIGNVFLDARQSLILEFIDSTIERESHDIEQDFNSINLSPAISVGYEYNMGERFILRVEPTFQYSMMSLTDAPIEERLYSAGLNVTCYLK